MNYRGLLTGSSSLSGSHEPNPKDLPCDCEHVLLSPAANGFWPGFDHLWHLPSVQRLLTIQCLGRTYSPPEVSSPFLNIQTPSLPPNMEYSHYSVILRGWEYAVDSFFASWDLPHEKITNKDAEGRKGSRGINLTHSNPLGVHAFLNPTNPKPYKPEP